MATENVTVIVRESWELIAATAGPLLQFRVLGDDEVLFNFEDVRPTEPMDGIRLREGRYENLTGSVWARAMGRPQRLSVVRTRNSSNPEIVRLVPLAVTSASPSVGAQPGDTLANIEKPPEGVVLRWEPDLEPGGARVDRRVAVSTDGTALFAGTSPQREGELTGTLVQLDERSPDSPFRQRVSISVYTGTPPEPTPVVPLGSVRGLLHNMTLSSVV